MATVDPLMKLIDALEAENVTLLNTLHAQDARFSILEDSVKALNDLVLAQDEQLKELATLCETLSKDE